MRKKASVSSGVSHLDRLLGGLFIGDNVVWYDHSGSLASVFCLNFLQASLSNHKPVIYVTFDRSPRNLLDKLGPLADSPNLTILDAFTCGKGASTSVFMKFYEEPDPERLCHIRRVEKPGDMDYVIEALYGLHEALSGDVRLVFESITGMQKLWGGEEAVQKFYSHSCPRLYELNTIAYWIMEKLAHSPQLRAQINQIAQVAIDLSIKRGTTTLTILKAEGRSTADMHEPCRYWTKGLAITFDRQKQGANGINLGSRVKELRMRQGLSQAELAKLVGVTPSTISQVETDIIYPSLPALLKMAEVLSVDVGSLLQPSSRSEKQIIFPAAEAVEAGFEDIPSGSIQGKLLTPPDFQGNMEPYIIEIEPHQELPAHFFLHKGEEIGYVLSGKLNMVISNATYTIRAGDVIYLTAEMPSQWKNPGPNVARLLWIKEK